VSPLQKTISARLKVAVMKKAGSIVLLLLLCLQVFAQLPPPGESRDYYYKKSDAFRQEAWLKLIVGGGMMIGGFVAFTSSLDSDSQSGSEVFGIIMLAGFPVALTSVPTFVKAAKYERRGEMMLGVKLQPPPPGTPSFVKNMPSVGITLQW
jgi:hypothetical protein